MRSGRADAGARTTSAPDASGCAADAARRANAEALLGELDELPTPIVIDDADVSLLVASDDDDDVAVNSNAAAASQRAQLAALEPPFAWGTRPPKLTALVEEDPLSLLCAGMEFPSKQDLMLRIGALATKLRMRVALSKSHIVRNARVAPGERAHADGTVRVLLRNHTDGVKVGLYGRSDDVLDVVIAASASVAFGDIKWRVNSVCGNLIEAAGASSAFVPSAYSALHLAPVLVPLYEANVSLSLAKAADALSLYIHLPAPAGGGNGDGLYDDDDAGEDAAGSDTSTAPGASFVRSCMKRAREHVLGSRESNAKLMPALDGLLAARGYKTCMVACNAKEMGAIMLANACAEWEYRDRKKHPEEFNKVDWMDDPRRAPLRNALNQMRNLESQGVARGDLPKAFVKTFMWLEPTGICAQGRNALRPMLSIDAAHLKCGHSAMEGGGTLFSAVTYGPDNEIVPLAHMVHAASEDQTSWELFLDFVFSHLPVYLSREAVIVSDGDKGITAAMASCAPFAQHLLCAQHRRSNLYQYCGAKSAGTHKAVGLFSSMARATSLEHFARLALNLAGAGDIANKSKKIILHDRTLESSFPAVLCLATDDDKAALKAAIEQCINGEPVNVTRVSMGLSTAVSLTERRIADATAAAAAAVNVGADHSNGEVVLPCTFGRSTSSHSESWNAVLARGARKMDDFLSVIVAVVQQCVQLYNARRRNEQATSAAQRCDPSRTGIDEVANAAREAIRTDCRHVGTPNPNVGDVHQVTYAWVNKDIGRQGRRTHAVLLRTPNSAEHGPLYACDCGVPTVHGVPCAHVLTTAVAKGHPWVVRGAQLDALADNPHLYLHPRMWAAHRRSTTFSHLYAHNNLLPLSRMAVVEYNHDDALVRAVGDNMMPAPCRPGRGRPSEAKRKRAAAEAHGQGKRKQQRCTHCHILGHRRNKCPRMQGDGAADRDDNNGADDGDNDADDGDMVDDA